MLSIGDIVSFKARHNPDVYVFGENHSNADEVNRIRQQVLKLKPDYVIHELDWEDKDFYKKHGMKVLPLEPSNVEGRKLPKDLKEQFKIREKEMIKTIKKIKPGEKVVIVIGDTHLRTIQTPELGPASPLGPVLKSLNAKISRSKNKEIR